jgi:hypothetical protein
LPGAAASCSTPVAATDGAGVAVDAIVCVGVGEPDAAGLGVVCGAGVALGTSNRPRRCDAVGKGDADDSGVEVVVGVGDCSNGVALRGVIVGSTVDVAAAVGAGVADNVADGIGVAATGVEAGVSEP